MLLRQSRKPSMNLGVDRPKKTPLISPVPSSDCYSQHQRRPHGAGQRPTLRAVQACDFCRQRKTKCDEGRLELPTSQVFWRTHLISYKAGCFSMLTRWRVDFVCSTYCLQILLPQLSTHLVAVLPLQPSFRCPLPPLGTTSFTFALANLSGEGEGRDGALGLAGEWLLL